MNTNNINQSTGPITDLGKQISSRNAIKHGCCSNDTLIIANAGETIEQFQALEATWFQTYNPKDEIETHLLDLTIEADWFLQRSNRTLAQIEADIYNLNPIPMNWNDRDHHAIQRFTRYQTARRNEFNKARKALDDHRKIQAAEQRHEAAAQRSMEKQEIVKAKFEIYKQKSKPKPTLSQQLAELRQARESLNLKPTQK